MTRTFRVTLAQMNPTVGDLDGNARLARQAWEAGRDAGADMVALGEMFLTGWPLLDLGRRPGFVAAAMDAVADLARDCAEGPALGIGAPHAAEGKPHNAWCVCAGGAVVARVLKHTLSHDEARIHAGGPICGPVRVGPVRIGVAVGEDAHAGDVAEALEESGAQILLVPSAAPYRRGRFELRVNRMVARSVETRLPLVCLNLAGGQDDQVFDGGSFALNPGGALAHQLPVFETRLRHVDFEEGTEGWRAIGGEKARLPDEWEQDYRAMVEALRDRCAKSGRPRVLLGLAGGIDDALAATIAADALGSGNLRCVALRPEGASPAAPDGVAAVVRALGCRFDAVSIEGVRAALGVALAPLAEGRGADETEIGARLGGLVLAALTDGSGEMLLHPVNKSDLALGRATISGGSAGYNPVGDLYRSRMAGTCRWRNANRRPWMKGPEGEVIPPGMIAETPAAGLPPCEKLDSILEAVIERDRSIGEIVAMGHDRVVVKRIEEAVHRAERERLCPAPLVRLTGRAFGSNRRYPIVNRWRDPS